MRRAVITGSVLLMLLVAAWLPVAAQRRGGGAVSRGAMHSSAMQSAPMRSYGVRSYAGHAYAGRSYVPRANVTVRRMAPARRWGGGVGFGFGFGHGARPYHHHRRYYSYYPYVYGYPYYAPYAYVGGYPYFDSGVYYANSYDNSEQNEYQQQQLNAEIGSLNQQIEDLRDENDSLRDYVERSRTSAPAPQGPDRSIPQSLQQPIESATPPAPATVLVFRDGHQVEVHNYAIVGKTLWALSENRSVKYPLADLDLEKTTQENEKRGVEFAGAVE